MFTYIELLTGKISDFSEICQLHASDDFPWNHQKRVLYFPNWRPAAILDFKIMMILLYCWTRVDDSCQLWSISDYWFWSYSNICKFQVGGHLGFCKHFLP